MEEAMSAERIPAEAFPPGEYLKEELVERGWTQEELASIIGRAPIVISQIISGKRGITPETAQAIGAALGTSAMFWMNLDASYRLWRAGPAPSRIREEASVRERYPVREMLKRGWLKGSENPNVLKQQVLGFFGIKEIDEEPHLMHAARKSGYPADINGPQRAWLFRVRQIAHGTTTKPYSEKALREALTLLSQLRASPESIRRVPKILADCGVCFVVVEHVPASKIDGVCFWLERRPVIGVSLRLDRIDNFWFVLRHEIEHVLNKDGRDVAVIDSDLTGVRASDISVEERRADAAAADFCVESSEMTEFLMRYSPNFSEQNVLGFAQRISVHPGLVVGQLQHRTGNYRLFRKHLVNVRDIVAASAMTDGYGRVIPF
jgi:HTH-type transcriptional regulator/antitoxin HigA